MKKLLRTLLGLIAFVLVILAGVLTINTVSFSSKQIPVTPISAITVSDDAINRFAKVVQIPTVSNNNYIDTTAFRQLDSFIQQTYPLVDSFLEKNIINQFSYIFKWPGRNPNLKPLLLLAHQDVVDVEEKSKNQWTYPPFSGKIADGYLYGRGTLDDKSNIFALLEAIEFLLKEDYSPERTIYLGFGHDEEISGQNGAVKMAEWFAQQKIDFDFILDEGSFILKDGVDGLEQPFAMIGIAEKGYATLDVTVQLEEGGHSSMPPAESAIVLLSRAINRLQDNPFPAQIDGASAGLFEYIAPEMGLFQKVIFANLWLTESIVLQQLSNSPASNAMIRTTAAPTMIAGGVQENVLPTQAKVTINFRILPGETIESTIDYVGQIIDDSRIVVTQNPITTSNNPSEISSIRAFGFQVLQKSIQQIFPNTVVAPSLVIAATDSRHFQSLTENIYRFTPVVLAQSDLSRIHGIDERIGLEDYKGMIRFYQQLILNVCK